MELRYPPSGHTVHNSQLHIPPVYPLPPHETRGGAPTGWLWTAIRCRRRHGWHHLLLSWPPPHCMWHRLVALQGSSKPCTLRCGLLARHRVQRRMPARGSWCCGQCYLLLSRPHGCHGRWGLWETNIHLLVGIRWQHRRTTVHQWSCCCSSWGWRTCRTDRFPSILEEGVCIHHHWSSATLAKYLKCEKLSGSMMHCQFHQMQIQLRWPFQLYYSYTYGNDISFPCESNTCITKRIMTQKNNQTFPNWTLGQEKKEQFVSSSLNFPLSQLWQPQLPSSVVYTLHLASWRRSQGKSMIELLKLDYV